MKNQKKHTTMFSINARENSKKQAEILKQVKNGKFSDMHPFLTEASQLRIANAIMAGWWEKL